MLSETVERVGPGALGIQGASESSPVPISPPASEPAHGESGKGAAGVTLPPAAHVSMSPRGSLDGERGAYAGAGGGGAGGTQVEDDRSRLRQRLKAVMQSAAHS